MSGFASGSRLGSCLVRVWFVSGSCVVRVCFGSGSGLGSCLVRVWFVSGSYSVVFGLSLALSSDSYLGS